MTGGRWRMGLVVAVLTLTALGRSATPAQAVGRGFDVVLVVDDSGSMGTASSHGPASDKAGRRIQVLTVLRDIFYQITAHSKAVRQEAIDFRLSVVRFGDAAKVFEDWTVIDSTTPPAFQTLTPDNLGNTDFSKALESARLQLAKLAYGQIGQGITRKPIIILLTDGEPSTRARLEGLTNDDTFWSGLAKNQIQPIRQANGEFRFLVVPFRSPSLDYWPKVKDRWAALGAETLPMPGEKDNSHLYKDLRAAILEKIYPLEPLTPSADGSFMVPCYQQQLNFNIFFFEPWRQIVLIDPHQNRLDDRSLLRLGTDRRTTTQFTIAEPTPGRWRIADYDAEAYFATYQPLPFAVSYSYPQNRVFLQKPQAIALDVTANGSMPRGLVAQCKLQGSVEIQDAGGKHTLPLTITETDKGFHAETPPYAPPAGAKPGPVEIRAVITSDGTPVLRDQPTRCQVADVRPVWLDIQESRLVRGTSDTSLLSLRVLFRGPSAKGLLMPATDVYVDPGRALAAVITCPVGDCAPRSVETGQAVGERLPSAGAQTAVRYRIPVTPLDPHRLGVDIHIATPPDPRIGWLVQQRSKLMGEGGRIGVAWEEQANARLADKVLLAGKVTRP